MTELPTHIAELPEGYQLLRPIPIEVLGSNGNYISRVSGEINFYRAGSGRTPDEACKALCGALSRLYDRYDQDDDQLSGLARYVGIGITNFIARG